VEQRRKIRDEGEARRCLAAAEAAGGDVGQWARAHGIDGRSLHTWRMNIARRGETARGGASRREAQARRLARSGLVELVPVRVPARPTKASSRYVLRLGDVCLEFDDAVGAGTLRRVLEVLRAC
jgi:hypothetical protein